LLPTDGGDEIEFFNYKYGYFSIITFIIPFRWFLVRRFRTRRVVAAALTGGAFSLLDALEVEAQVARPLMLGADGLAAVHDASLSKRPIDINCHVAALRREHCHFLKAELAVCRFAFASEIHQGVHRSLLSD